MLFRILFTLIITLIISGCSSGPDYKRDNLFDPEADTPAAKIIYWQGERAEEEFDSFIVIVNAAVINQNVTLELKSDKDGIIYSNDNISSDTLRVGYTKLSGPVVHTISLLVDDVKEDEIRTLVSKAYKVTMYEPTWNDFQPSLKWSKYRGEDFESYTLKIIEYKKAITIKEFTNINDTMYTHYEYPIRENFRYFIETKSKKYARTNSSNEIEINLNTFQIPYSKPIYFGGLYYYYYSNCGYTGSINECFLKSLSSANDSKTKSIGNFYPRSLRFSSASLTPDLLVTSEDNINIYDARDLSLISEHKNLSEGLNNYRKDVSSLYYHEPSSNYFITFGYGTGSGPYTFNSNFVHIGNNLQLIDQNGTYFLGANGNVLLAVDAYRPDNLISYSISPEGDITKTNQINLNYGTYTRAVSITHNKLFLGNDGKIFSADSNLERLGSLPTVPYGYSDFHINTSSPDTLYASSYPHTLYKIHIPSNEIVSAKEYHYEIVNILSSNGKLFLILKSDDRIIVPLKPDNYD